MSKVSPQESSSTIALAKAAPVSLGEALSALPIDMKEFNKTLSRWMKVVRRLRLLTSAQRSIALTIATVFINRDQKRLAHYRTAWPSNETLAAESGCTSRTVTSALPVLRELGLLAYDPKGGARGRGGRTSRYTIRIDRLDTFEAIVERQQVPNKFPHLPERINSFPRSESSEILIERGELSEAKRGNSMTKDPKPFRTTFKNTSNYLFKSSVDKWSGNGRSAEASVPSTAHASLAEFLGQGSVEEGFLLLGLLEEDEVGEIWRRQHDEKIDRKELLLEIEQRSRLRKRT